MSTKKLSLVLAALVILLAGVNSVSVDRADSQYAAASAQGVARGNAGGNGGGNSQQAAPAAPVVPAADTPSYAGSSETVEDVQTNPETVADSTQESEVSFGTETLVESVQTITRRFWVLDDEEITRLKQSGRIR